MSTSVVPAFRQFLSDNGWRETSARPLAGDASNRRYLRLAEGDRRAVLMDVTGEPEALHPFVAMTDWLRSHDYSAPEILAIDYANGYLLLEDLGDNLYSHRIAQRPDEEAMLYERAVELLADLVNHPAPAKIGRVSSETLVSPQNPALLVQEAMLMPEWWMQAASGEAPDPSAVAEYQDLIGTAASGLTNDPRIMVLRDFHADNLLWLPDRPGLGAVGLLDYQDVVAGYPAYDLVSLLEDARRDTSPEMREAMIQHYLSRRPEEDASAFRLAYAVLGAQRNLRIVGVFTRLAVRDRKPRYLDMIPRVWDHLQNDLSHPELAPLKAWVGRHVAPPERATLARVAAQVAQ